MWNLISKKRFLLALSCRRRRFRFSRQNPIKLMSVAKKRFAFIELYGSVNGLHHATVDPSLQDVFEFILRFFGWSSDSIPKWYFHSASRNAIKWMPAKLPQGGSGKFYSTQNFLDRGDRSVWEHSRLRWPCTGGCHNREFVRERKAWKQKKNVDRVFSPARRIN
jgi:hypothetical protein